MSDIYTRSGDDGSTSIVGGERVSKSDPRIAFYGALDEADCAVGSARVVIRESGVDSVLEFLQHRLFNCAACALVPVPAGAARVDVADIAALEAAIDRYSNATGGFTGFALPGCDEASARLHHARAALPPPPRRSWLPRPSPWTPTC
jgi:cob(I)alamin adenosyltransferase